MASMPPASRSEDDESTTATTSAVDEQTVNVQVLSPSVGVTRPLLFPGLAASTTVKQLKDKIRQTLPLRPADENQRLIHRGRAIVRESDTLLDIFGTDAVRNPEQQTIHLVIRDVQDNQSSASTVPAVSSSLPASAPGPNTTASAPPTNPPRAQPQHPQGHAFGYQMPWRNSMPPTSNPFPQPRMPSPSPSHTPEQAAAFQHHHQNMTQWLNNIQREAMTRAINQNQRTRAQMGMRGVGDNGLGTAPAGENGGRASPAPGQTIYREHVGPNGHTYQVETVIRTGGSGQPGIGGAAVSMSPADVHNIIRSADINQATATAASAAASAIPRNTTTTTTIIIIPALIRRPITRCSNRKDHFLNPALSAQAQVQGQGQGQVQNQEQEPGEFMGPLMHRGNPPMAAIPPLLMQLWPQIWLLFRLAIFVWFFTSPDASWSRWFTIIVIAVFIFVLSTGVFNGVPDHVWRPLGRHLENLIPLDPRPQQGVAVREQQNQENPPARQDPDPTEMARRLVAQHQGPDSWILSQVRRMERAGLLFLASIAPGVAERHIANLEAAARAERERIEAEAREAEAAAQNNENDESRAVDEGEGTIPDAETNQVERAPEDDERLEAEREVHENNQHGEHRGPLIQI
ncbi:hypothetical protein FLONG3_1408 [Fusarium longipes]|uniref:Ubiquitin family n=1 Tax=Fusarium longipes TaxID=694270 RepID=A0A395T6Z7_9HYPO|nr:hypothetical protein FLONG3_1408 [Fusarium longipes]